MPADYFTFFRELRESFSEVGSIFPSSRFLANAMVRPLDEQGVGRRILEVGPGTGPITRQILRRLNSRDELFICEVNARFLQRLKTSLQKNPYYQLHRQQVHFFECPIQQLRVEQALKKSFNIIICSLPFTNFTPDVVHEIIDIFQELLTPNGSVTFFEYIGLRKLSAMFSNHENRERIQAVDSVLQGWRDEVRKCGEVRTELEFFNLPPAVAVQLQY